MIYRVQAGVTVTCHEPDARRALVREVRRRLLVDAPHGAKADSLDFDTANSRLIAGWVLTADSADRAGWWALTQLRGAVQTACQRAGTKLDPVTMTDNFTLAVSQVPRASHRTHA
ncbi:hypothetical protein [Amycolatopsis anabasis]|uniref:hypothetical protein n=1 Tax=Amycolatopsis anabasis TaxID=1840409 RepID=UPI00131A8EAB|nr:hypothetical protein [Amycolatopsis anabasis]